MAVEYKQLRMIKRPEMTVNNILDAEISEAYEDESNYFILLKTSDPYANENYILNKKDHGISWVHFTDLIAADVFDEATEISPEELKRVLK